MFKKNINKNNANIKGFSLIELSAVISVAATVAVGYLSWTQPELKTSSEKSISTFDKIKRISESIESFRVKEGRLPCPADPFIRKDNTMAGGANVYQNNFGNEGLDTSDQQINGITTLGVDCPQNVGVVPVNSLEIEDDYMFDAWGNYISYQVSDNLCGSDEGTAILTDDESLLRGCTSIDYNTRSGNISINNGVENITKNAAYILVSHGANAFGAFLSSGQQKSFDDASDAELQNIRVLTNDDAVTGMESLNSVVTSPNQYVQVDTSASFDDIILYKTRVQVEKLTTRKNQQLLTFQECEDNSTMISNLSFNDTLQLKDNVSATNLGGTLDGETVAIGVFLSIQSACVEFAKYTSTGGGNSWKIDNKTWIPQCPGAASFIVNDSTKGTGTCQCASGNWSSC